MKLNLKICQFFILKTNLYANHSAHRIYLQPKEADPKGQLLFFGEGKVP